MNKNAFKPRTMVKDTKTGREGVVVEDLPGMLRCCGDDEVPVVFYGTTSFYGTDYRRLEILGTEEAEADMQRCGAGKGADCCMFLTVGSSGPECERFGHLRHSLFFKEMTAKRNPAEPFPACQKF